MAVDALAPCIARSSTAMVLNMHDNLAFVCHKEEFQLSVLCQSLEMFVSYYILDFILQKKWSACCLSYTVNTMATEALAPSVAKASISMVLNK